MSTIRECYWLVLRVTAGKDVSENRMMLNSASEVKVMLAVSWLPVRKVGR